MHRLSGLAAAAAIWLVALAGCGERQTDYSELNLVDVTGRVTMDGQPLAGVSVRFEGPPSRFASGQTDAAGQYRLMYDSNQAGCTPGEKTVRIVAGSAEGGEESAPVEGPDGQVLPPASQQIPSQYNSDSKLTANVSPTSRTFDFDLKSKP
jgi:hypothetical protein